MSFSKAVIYVRHGHDRQTHYAFDERLTNKGKEEAKRKAEQLLSKYGMPDMIRCSPYNRTRATLKQFLKVCKEHDSSRLPKVVIDARLGRFFTKNDREEFSKVKKEHKKNLRQSKQVCLHPKRENVLTRPLVLGTLKLAGEFVIDKDKHHFRKRVEQQFLRLQKKNKYSIIWNITHSLVIKHIARLTNKKDKLPDHLSFLEYLALKRK